MFRHMKPSLDNSGKRVPGQAFLPAFMVLAANLAIPCLARSGTGQLIAAAGTAKPAFAQEQNTAGEHPDLRVETPLVVVDVSVTDANGKPIHGLTASDFTLFEDGGAMSIKSLEERQTSVAQPAAMPKRNLGVNGFSDVGSTPAGNGPLNVLLLDALDTAEENQARVRAQMLAYVAKFPAGTQMAVFGLSSRLVLLQGFTADPELLKAAIYKDLPKGSALNLSVNDNVYAMPPGGKVVVTPLPRGLPTAEGELAGNREESRADALEDALNGLARYLSGLPGRKNLIWFSEAFPGAGMANRFVYAHVAVYPADLGGPPVDPHFTGPVTLDDNRTDPSGAKVTGGDYKHGVDAMTRMQQWAELTGGKAFYNNNSLSGAVQQVLDQGSNYYTLTYTPRNGHWDGKYREIGVKVDREHVQLDYRRGYFAENPAVVAKSMQSRSRVGSAMQFGAPALQQILFDVSVDPAGATEKAPAAGNHPAATMKPPYRRYSVLYASYLRGATFTTAGKDAANCDIEFVAVAYDADGHAVNMVSSAVHAMTAAQYAALMQHGMLMRQEIDVPAQGSYFLRIGVHDLSSDRIGVVEVPLSSVQAQPVASGQSQANPTATSANHP
jgi:VWFA-related protein